MQQVRDLSARLLGIASIGVDLGQEVQTPYDLRISALVRLGDQLSPQGARLVVTVGRTEQDREQAPPFVGSGPVGLAAGPLDLQRAVEQVSPNATGAPERDLGDCCQAEDERLRLGQLL